MLCVCVCNICIYMYNYKHYDKIYLSIISDETFESDKFAFTNLHTRKLQVVAVKVLHPGMKNQLKYSF